MTAGNRHETCISINILFCLFLVLALNAAYKYMLINVNMGLHAVCLTFCANIKYCSQTHIDKITDINLGMHDVCLTNIFRRKRFFFLVRVKTGIIIHVFVQSKVKFCLIRCFDQI